MYMISSLIGLFMGWGLGEVQVDERLGSASDTRRHFCSLTLGRGADDFAESGIGQTPGS